MRSQRAASAYVSRAQIAAGIVWDRPLRRRWFDLSLPRTIVPPGRYEHPLTAERIESPVRMFAVTQRSTLKAQLSRLDGVSILNGSKLTRPKARLSVEPWPLRLEMRLETSYFTLHTSHFFFAHSRSRGANPDVGAQPRF